MVGKKDELSDAIKVYDQIVQCLAVEGYQRNQINTLKKRTSTTWFLPIIYSRQDVTAYNYQGETRLPPIYPCSG